MAVILAVKNIKSQCAIRSTKAHKRVFGPEINRLSLTVYSVEKLGGLNCRRKRIIRTATRMNLVPVFSPDFKKKS